MKLTRNIKKSHRQWSKHITKGTGLAEAGNYKEAIVRFERGRTLAIQLLDATIMEFDGDILFLDLHNFSVACLQEVYQEMGDSAAAEACLVEAKRKYLAVLRNPAYPTLVRGKVIRAVKGLIELAVRFYNSEGRRTEAYKVADSWIKEIKQFVAKMPSFQQTVAMN